jgi:hypothetical protein
MFVSNLMLLNSGAFSEQNASVRLGNVTVTYCWRQKCFFFNHFLALFGPRD